ncbi:MAG: FAD-dependent oxidoreductase, partial [Bradymonadaceae bacterium]
MLKDARELSADDVLEADVCIVGAGAAGITLARQIGGDGADVLLLEAGGHDQTSRAQSLYDGKSTGALGNIELAETRIRAFGGTTRVWGGYCRPLQPIDFEQRD